MLLQIEQSELGNGVALVNLKGRLALGRESQRIETLIEELTAADRKGVIFDLTGVDYVDSAGIGMLALAAGKLKENGGRLAVVAAGGKVLNMLTMTQINKIMAVRPTVAEAAAALEETLPPAAA